MKILTIYPGSVNDRHIAEAVGVLRDGGIIIYPTDTLYAFGCDALNNRAIERLCHLKGLNPAKNLLSVVCSDISQAAEYARIDNHAFRILKQYLPGPFTFILPSSTTLPKVFKGRKSVGIRVPDNEIALALARELGNPLMTSSIPLDDFADTGYVEAVDPRSVALKYENEGEIELAIDGGEGSTEPSTVVDILDSTSPEILRHGRGEFEE